MSEDKLLLVREDDRFKTGFLFKGCVFPASFLRVMVLGTEGYGEHLKVEGMVLTGVSEILEIIQKLFSPGFLLRIY